MSQGNSPDASNETIADSLLIPKADLAAFKVQPDCLAMLFPELGTFTVDFNSLHSFSIGRATENQLEITDESVRIDVLDSRASREHCRCRKNQSGHWEVYDNSRNGTWLNGRPLEKEQWTLLTAGSTLAFGATVLWWQVKVAGATNLGYSACNPEQLESLSFDVGIRKFLDRTQNIPESLPVLLLGPTGVGKTHLAKYIHGARVPKAPFVQFNCANANQHLLEVTLFGARAGAYTDAKQDQQGLVAQAQDGTLFLDEIGELPLELQAKLLTFLDTGEYRPLGAKEAEHAQCGIIAATNRDLALMAQENLFRSDLYFRLNGLTYSVPSLTTRKFDLAALMHRRLPDIQEKDRRLPMRWLAYGWPGNVRELDRAISLYTHTGEDLVSNADSQNAAHASSPITGGSGVPSSGQQKPSNDNQASTSQKEAQGNIANQAASLQQFTRGELAVAFLKAELDLNILCEQTGLSQNGVTEQLSHHQLSRSMLLTENFRNDETLKKDVLNAVGKIKDIAPLFKRVSVYPWYRDEKDPS